MSFTISSNPSSSRTPLPRGFVNAVCGDFYVQEVDDNYHPGEKKTQVVLQFVTSHKTKNREGAEVNASINLFANASWGSSDKPSNLRKFITSWFGPLTDKQLSAFDFEKLVGKKVCILVEHYEKKDKSIGDKIGLATDVRPDLPQIESIPSDFKRKKDREDRKADADTKSEDDDLPF
jgi:hypothetical protein